MIDALNKKIQEIYNGTRELSVDESMIKFKGRSVLKQYLPIKPIKRGYKLWCLADQRGYIKKFQIYQRNDEELNSKFTGYGLGEKVALELTEQDWSKGKIVAVKDYNSYMGGVNTADRLRALYCIDRKSPKWWHRLFWGLLDIAFVNSYVIHGLIMEQTTVKDFRRSVTQDLMTMKGASQKRKTSTNNTEKGGPSKRRKSGYSTIKDVRLGNRGIHWPTFVGEGVRFVV